MAALLLAVLVASWPGRTRHSSADRSPAATPTPFSRLVTPASPISLPSAFHEVAWAASWREFVSSPANSPEREARLLTLLEELAAHDPFRALALTEGEGGHAVRLRRRGTVLRLWAKTDPDAAADWIALHLGKHPDARDAALGAVIEGTAARADPETALTLLRRLELEYPADAETRRGELVAAWARQGAFDRAAAFASDARGEERADLLDTAFGAWVQDQPVQAAQAALHLRDRSTREQAWRSVVAGWAPRDPAALARFAVALPQAQARAEALGQALPHWFLREPREATTWMDRREPSAELDPGAACIASFAPLVRLRPEVALGWAEGIVNPELRRTILCDVVQIWSHQDLEAARHYAARHGLPGPGF